SGRPVRIVWTVRGVVGLLSVGAPVSLDLASVGVHHRHPPVAVAVGHVAFIGLRIDVDLRHTPEVLGIVAAGILALMAGLQHELAVLAEFEDLSIFCAITTEPNIALMVDKDAVHRFWPFVAFAWSAPRTDGVAVLIEREHRRRATTARRDRRIELGAFFVVVQRLAATVDHPDVVLGIDRYPDGHAEQPSLGNGFGQSGSTSKIGTSTVACWAVATLSSMAPPMPKPVTMAASAAACRSCRPNRVIIASLGMFLSRVQIRHARAAALTAITSRGA